MSKKNRIERGTLGKPWKRKGPLDRSADKGNPLRRSKHAGARTTLKMSAEQRRKAAGDKLGIPRRRNEALQPQRKMGVEKTKGLIGLLRLKGKASIALASTSLTLILAACGARGVSATQPPKEIPGVKAPVPGKNPGGGNQELAPKPQVVGFNIPPEPTVQAPTKEEILANNKAKIERETGAKIVEMRKISTGVYIGIDNNGTIYLTTYGKVTVLENAKSFETIYNSDGSFTTTFYDENDNPVAKLERGRFNLNPKLTEINPEPAAKPAPEPGEGETQTPPPSEIQPFPIDSIRLENPTNLQEIQITGNWASFQAVALTGPLKVTTNNENIIGNEDLYGKVLGVTPIQLPDGSKVWVITSASGCYLTTEGQHCTILYGGERTLTANITDPGKATYESVKKREEETGFDIVKGDIFSILIYQGTEPDQMIKANTENPNATSDPLSNQLIEGPNQKEVERFLKTENIGVLPTFPERTYVVGPDGKLYDVGGQPFLPALRAGAGPKTPTSGTNVH